MASNQQPTWMAQVSLNLASIMHDFRWHPKKILSDFDLDKSITLKYHIESLYLALCLMNVQHEYVMCLLFPFTFENKVATRYYTLPVALIANWNQFQKVLMCNFGDDKTLTTLLRELVSFNMDKKEKVKYFNQHFTTLLNKIPANTALQHVVTINIMHLPPYLHRNVH